jgi:hypothetical protein
MEVANNMTPSRTFSSKNEVIDSFERFLHYTCRCNRESIERRGLRPAFMSPDMTAGENEPDVLRYCIPAKAMDTCKMIRGKYLALCECKPKIIEINVPGRILSGLKHGLDRSASTTVTALARLAKSEAQLTPDEYHAIIVETGYISCYDPIPAGTFAIVEL